MGPLFIDKQVKFHDPSFNRSRESPPPKPSEAIFSVSSYNLRPEIDNDLISGLAVDTVGVDFHIKSGDSRSSGFRYIRGADFVSNAQTSITEAYPNSAKRVRVSPKNNNLSSFIR